MSLNLHMVLILVSYYLSDVQDYIENIIKKHKRLTTLPPIHVQINKINNRSVFKIKGGYKLELQTPEKVKLFDSIKPLTDKTRHIAKSWSSWNSFSPM